MNLSHASFELLKRIASHLPEALLVDLKQLHYRRAIRLNRFLPDEPEDAILDSLIAPGDWVIDVGANIGHYTKRFSELVGSNGRVIAFEPVPVTFQILAGNASRFGMANLTLLNVAVSDHVGEIGFTVPTLGSGLKNYYMARAEEQGNEFKVMSLPIDALRIKKRVSLVKIDVEGHEFQALKGMVELLARYHPALIVETRSDSVIDFLHGYGYKSERMDNSPNVVFRYTCSPD